MHFPLDFYFGDTLIKIHFVFNVLAFVVGYWLYSRQLKKTEKAPLPVDVQGSLFISVVFGSFIGSRLISALEHPTLFFHPPTLAFYIAGSSITGGIIGAVVAVNLQKKRLSVNRKTGDYFVYPLLVAMMIGRIGCFLTGVSDHTVGLASNLPWAFDQGDGIPRHPTSLYEIIFLGLLWFILKYIQKKNWVREGDTFRLFLIGYFAFRFFIEFIKPVETVVLGLSSIQILSIIVVVYYGVYLLKYKNHLYGKQ